MQDDAAVLHLDIDHSVLGDLAFEDQKRRVVADDLLNHPLERSGTEDRVVTLVREVRERLGGHVQGDPTRRESLPQLGHLDLDDAREIGLGQRRETDDLVDAVDELGLEVLDGFTTTLVKSTVRP